MQPIALPDVSVDELAALDQLYHTTRDGRLRTPAQIILLAAETIHAVTAAGFELKLVLFLLAYSLDCLVG